jgi:hypothetical protein
LRKNCISLKSGKISLFSGRNFFRPFIVGGPKKARLTPPNLHPPAAGASEKVKKLECH